MTTYKADIAIVGAGTAGCVAANRLVRAGRRVTLIEAGPDYGPRDRGAWPSDLLEPTAIPNSHDWGHTSTTADGRTIAHERARVVGGCSAHNHCAVVWGSRGFWDSWGDLAPELWQADAMHPRLARLTAELHTRDTAPEQQGTVGRAFIEAACHALAIPPAGPGFCEASAGFAAFNIDFGVRFNAAFAFLDEIRDHDEFELLSGVRVDGIEIDRDRAIGVRATRGKDEIEIDAELVILCAGAYGTAEILLRSGVGDPVELGESGVGVRHPLVEVGRGLRDHPAVALVFVASERAERALAGSTSPDWMPSWGPFAKAASSVCSGDFDLHLFPTHVPSPAGGHLIIMAVSCVAPLSVGALRLASAEPGQLPVIDHRYLSDPADHDLRVMIDGVRLARATATHERFRPFIAGELEGTAKLVDDSALAAWIKASVAHYWHPAGTCRMGTSAQNAVTDPYGRVLGLDGLVVADASLLPQIPDANTQLPAAACADAIAGAIAAR